MENKKRLIDANALSEKIGNMKSAITHNRGGYQYCNEDEKKEWEKLDGFDNLVCDAPTIDAVEVVRCKDCKWIENGKDYEPYCNHWKSGLYADVKDDDFCSYGERRTDNA